MDFHTHWFSPTLLTAAAVLCAVLLALCAPAAWHSLKRRPEACLTAFSFSAFLWIMRVEAPAGQLAGIGYHLLGINLACLMLGCRTALWLATLPITLYGLVQPAAASAAVPLNILTLALPACAANLFIRRTAESRLPPQLFVYIFINGFFAAAFGMLLVGAAVCAVLQTSGAFSGSILWREAYPVFFLMAWSEAFLSGILTAVFVALLPQMLATFSDNRYLKPPERIWK